MRRRRGEKRGEGCFVVAVVAFTHSPSAAELLFALLLLYRKKVGWKWKQCGHLRDYEWLAPLSAVSRGPRGRQGMMGRKWGEGGRQREDWGSLERERGGTKKPSATLCVRTLPPMARRHSNKRPNETKRRTVVAVSHTSHRSLTPLPADLFSRPFW